MNAKCPMIAHIVHRFDVGGLENGVVNLINHLPSDKYQHVIICLTDYSSDYFSRIKQQDVKIYSLHKKEGKDPAYYLRLWRLLRKLRPTITHSRNIATIDAAVTAALAGVKFRVHGEHGRDIYDVDGSNKKYRILRRLCQPAINTFIALSKDLSQWLLIDVGISPNKVVQLYNGVDTAKFGMAEAKNNALLPHSWVSDERIVIFGTVGRLEPIKDQLTLLRAFASMLDKYPGARSLARLIIVGDGQLRKQYEDYVVSASITEFVWFAGKRDDIADLLLLFDVFTLPSKGEGISNTILEAMSCSLPVVATAVGGNKELVVDSVTGFLVAPENPEVFADAMVEYINNKPLRVKHGSSGRQRVEKEFSMRRMTQNYMSVYDSLLMG